MTDKRVSAETRRVCMGTLYTRLFFGYMLLHIGKQEVRDGHDLGCLEERR